MNQLLEQIKVGAADFSLAFKKQEIFKQEMSLWYWQWIVTPIKNLFTEGKHFVT